jgi:hypothetical protein
METVVPPMVMYGCYTNSSAFPMVPDSLGQSSALGFSQPFGSVGGDDSNNFSTAPHDLMSTDGSSLPSTVHPQPAGIGPEGSVQVPSSVMFEPLPDNYLSVGAFTSSEVAPVHIQPASEDTGYHSSRALPIRLGLRTIAPRENISQPSRIMSSRPCSNDTSPNSRKVSRKRPGSTFQGESSIPEGYLGVLGFEGFPKSHARKRRTGPTKGKRGKSCLRCVTHKKTVCSTTHPHNHS